MVQGLELSGFGLGKMFFGCFLASASTAAFFRAFSKETEVCLMLRSGSRGSSRSR